jgi:hypothetical protein
MPVHLAGKGQYWGFFERILADARGEKMGNFVASLEGVA